MKIGDVVNIKPTNQEKIIARAKIVDKKELSFINLPVRSRLAHEAYLTKEQQRKVFNNYYAFLGREVRDDNLFVVIDFKLIN